MTCSAPPDFPRRRSAPCGRSKRRRFPASSTSPRSNAKAPDDAIPALCGIKGIGPWTAEVYLLFAAGHPDIFPAADLALQEAARLAFALDARPAPRDLRVMSDAWSPWRSAAARLLWAYYRVKKGGKATAPV